MEHPMPTPALLATALAAALLGLGSCATRFEPDLNARAPQLDGFGAPALQAGTANAEARQRFGSGVLQAYAFNANEAVRMFKAALAQDPACAICAWGVAWQLGPNINRPDRDDLSQARSYIGLAQRNAATATPLERELIAAMALRYGVAQPTAAEAPLAAEVCGTRGARRAHPLDVLYAERMRALADAQPAHADVLSLYAEAELIATRNAWWDSKTGRPVGRVGEVATRLEAALGNAPDHTGLNHYLIHTLDSSNTAARAVAAADRLGRLAPASPHLVHMPAHIYVRVGRYGDAASVNQQGLAAEAAQRQAVKSQGFEPTGDWDDHNLHFLWFAALMQGRGSLALETARRMAERSAHIEHAYGAYHRSLPLLTLVRLERWHDVLAEPAAKETRRASGRGSMSAAVAQHARGLAFARTGQLAQAREQAVALERTLVAAKAAAKGKADDDTQATQADTVLVLHALLQAELTAGAGDLPGAQALLAPAIEAEDRIGGEPPQLAAMARVALGDLLLRHGRAAEAEAAFRADLAEQPGSGWALRGIVRSLAGQGRTADAEAARIALAAAWGAADTALR
jgi:predicted Zn-dependent protease